MGLTIVATSTQERYKDSYAVLNEIGLAVRANGEEKTKVLDAFANLQNAGIPAPSAPTVSVTGTTGLTPGAYSWRIVYAASKKYPLVDAGKAIGGSFAPRGNPSPHVSLSFATLRNVIVSCPASLRSDIDEIWIFRTRKWNTTVLSSNAADGGLSFYVGKLSNPPTTTFVDTLNDSFLVDSIELDNFEAPTFQFVEEANGYFWGWGNFPYIGEGFTLNATNQFVISSGKIFDGRIGQNFTLVDLNETYEIENIVNTSTVALKNVTFVGTSGYDFLIQGPATTLYRSKYRNPFAWGQSVNVNGFSIPELWAYKIGSGYGTAIKQVPNQSLLKLDTERPSKTYILNLRSLPNDLDFRNSLRCISTQYSVSSHFSQFVATLGNGNQVLWGIDFKNFAILQCDGASIVPITQNLPIVMRLLTDIKNRQIVSHGVYDPYTELNCLWVATNDSLTNCNFAIFQHAPTGQWGFALENDLLSSAVYENPTTGEIEILGGTETGLYGRIFDPSTFANWYGKSGKVLTATSNSITFDGSLIPAATSGVVGNWCLITDSNGGYEQWARIATSTANSLTFDLIDSFNGQDEFDPIPTSNSKFYIGLIECRLFKEFDLGLPTTDKSLKEFWLTQIKDQEETFIRYGAENGDVDKTFKLVQVSSERIEAESKAFFAKILPANVSKNFSIEIINRGYDEWQLKNFTIKPNVIKN